MLTEQHERLVRAAAAAVLFMTAYVLDPHSCISQANSKDFQVCSPNNSFVRSAVRFMRAAVLDSHTLMLPTPEF
jgi:hypothetical protein